jgi:hypothetical protein
VCGEVVDPRSLNTLASTNDRQISMSSSAIPSTSSCFLHSSCCDPGFSRSPSAATCFHYDTLGLTLSCCEHFYTCSHHHVKLSHTPQFPRELLQKKVEDRSTKFPLTDEIYSPTNTPSSLLSHCLPSTTTSHWLGLTDRRTLRIALRLPSISSACSSSART